MTETSAIVDEVRRRTGDPQFPYDPAAEWGDPGYREPRSDAEAAARTAYLDEHQPVAAMPPPSMSPLESELVDAEVDAHYASMARDGTYPAAAARVRELEAALDQQQRAEDVHEPHADHPGPQQYQEQHQEHSAMTTPAAGNFQLTDAQRDALTSELFAHWHQAEPDRFHCFCGTDADLVDAVNQARQREVRERSRDRELTELQRAEQRQREHDEIGS